MNEVQFRILMHLVKGGTTFWEKNNHCEGGSMSRSIRRDAFPLCKTFLVQEMGPNPMWENELVVVAFDQKVSFQKSGMKIFIILKRLLISLK